MLCRKSLSLVKELIKSCLVEADGSIQLHAAKVVTDVVTILLVKFIKHNQNYYLKLDILTSIRGLHQKKREPRELCHQLVSSDGDRQRARAFYQMDQRGHTHPKEGQQAMNRDEGSYQLSHAYDRFLDTASSRHIKNWKN